MKKIEKMITSYNIEIKDFENIKTELNKNKKIIVNNINKYDIYEAVSEVLIKNNKMTRNIKNSIDVPNLNNCDFGFYEIDEILIKKNDIEEIFKIKILFEFKITSYISKENRNKEIYESQELVPFFKVFKNTPKAKLKKLFNK